MALTNDSSPIRRFDSFIIQLGNINIFQSLNVCMIYNFGAAFGHHMILKIQLYFLKQNQLRNSRS